jgi:hypothetical protein
MNILVSTIYFIKFITSIWSSIPLLRVKITHIVDRIDLFKISNLV